MTALRSHAMANTLSPPADTSLYEEDFPLWAERQGALLRARRFEELDLDNLIEEVEGLSRKDRLEVESRAELILTHFLKLAFSPAPEPRRGWVRTILTQRRALARMLTGTLRSHLQEQLVELYAQARRMAAIEMETDAIEPEILPTECPYSIDEVLEAEWLPQNVYDLDRDES
jgi:Domain of unknown function DUF29